MSKPSIISASRRTDIPAYYSKWLMSRIDKGFTYYPNPFSQSPVFASLAPQDVMAIVFWTRNPKPLIEYLDIIDAKYSHYMHFTINGMPKEIEANNPNIDSAIETVKLLTDRYKNPNYVQWRFDPIVISNITNQDYIIEKFEYLAAKLRDYVSNCIISFVDLYKKTNQNLKNIEFKSNIKFHSPIIEEQIELSKELLKISQKYNIQLLTCAEEQLENIEGIKKAHCVDIDLIKAITSNEINLRQSPSRLGCGCYSSKDIGYYDSCPHGCIYCYSNLSPETAISNAAKYIKNGFKYDKMEPAKKINEDKLESLF